MRKRLAEETIIFVSVLKWFLLSTVTGTIVGAATAFFLKALNWSTAFAGHYNYYFLLMPIAFFLSSLTIKYVAPDAEGHV
jgi:H+/Cl- antiporter ClcA